VAAVRERLFDEHVLAPDESTFCQFVVGTDVGCDDYGVDIGFQEVVKVPIPFH
jgi:hypothetical protein